MAREYFNAYHSYLENMKRLSDAEVGRLFRALLKYSMTGTLDDLPGNERFVIDGMIAQIDRDSKKYEEKCRTNQRNRTFREKRPSTTVNDRKGNSTTVDKEKEKKKEKTKEKENNPPLIPPPGETGFGPELQSAFEAWLAYKQEKRQGYKPVGLKSLVTEIRNNATRYGEQAVADLIRECMASNWQGIIFDRLKIGPKPNGGQRQARKSFSEIIAEREGKL